MYVSVFLNRVFFHIHAVLLIRRWCTFFLWIGLCQGLKIVGTDCNQAICQIIKELFLSGYTYALNITFLLPLLEGVVIHVSAKRHFMGSRISGMCLWFGHPSYTVQTISIPRNGQYCVNCSIMRPTGSCIGPYMILTILYCSCQICVFFAWALISLLLLFIPSNYCCLPFYDSYVLPHDFHVIFTHFLYYYKHT